MAKRTKRANTQVTYAQPEVVTPKKKANKNVGTRAFQASLINRLTSDWVGSDSLNTDIQQGLYNLRSRSRDLSLNNEFARRYLKLIKSNVVGPEGVQLSVQATNPDGTMDSMNDRIESKFADWAAVDNCTVTGKLDWRKVQELVLETTARDGEALVWMRRGIQFGKYAFQLQLIDVEHLDENYNDTAANGNKIVQGVELNQFGRAVAYYLWRNHPSDHSLTSLQPSNERIRVDSSDILHIYDTERASQVRGFPWTCAAMTALQHISKYREAELVNARIASSKQLFYKQVENTAFTGDDDDVDDSATVTFESNPGSHEVLPKGWDVTKIDWGSPNQNLPEFQKTVLRGIAAGLGVSYHSLSSDLESVNYSSARFGSLEDQAMYQSMQRWFIDALVKPVYAEWLKIQMLTNAWGLNIPSSKLEKFMNVRFIPRRWSSVDPSKDIRADIEALNNSLTSYSDVIAKSGRDPAEVFAQIAKDKQLMAELGITPLDVQQKMNALSTPTVTQSGDEN